MGVWAAWHSAGAGRSSTRTGPGPITEMCSLLSLAFYRRTPSIVVPLTTTNQPTNRPTDQPTNQRTPFPPPTITVCGENHQSGFTGFFFFLFLHRVLLLLGFEFGRIRPVFFSFFVVFVVVVVARSSVQGDSWRRTHWNPFSNPFSNPIEPGSGPPKGELDVKLDIVGAKPILTHF